MHLAEINGNNLPVRGRVGANLTINILNIE